MRPTNGDDRGRSALGPHDMAPAAPQRRRARPLATSTIRSRWPRGRLFRSDVLARRDVVRPRPRLLRSGALAAVAEVPDRQLEVHPPARRTWEARLWVDSQPVAGAQLAQVAQVAPRGRRAGRDERAVGVAEGESALAVVRDREAVLVDQPMVAAAEQDEVSKRGLPAVGPVADVVGVGEPMRSAAREPASAVAGA